jgi:hypothetical protein
MRRVALLPANHGTARSSKISKLPPWIILSSVVRRELLIVCVGTCFVCNVESTLIRSGRCSDVAWAPGHNLDGPLGRTRAFQFSLYPQSASLISDAPLPLYQGSATRLHATPSTTWTQVVSDVDDTLKSSGGVNVAGVALGGIDVQYQRGVIYPGVAEFMLQLSLGPRPDAATEGIGPAKVAILTARAEEFKLALELKEDSPIAKRFREAARSYFGDSDATGADWGLGPVLYGSVAEWILQDRKGLRKFTNFERLLEQDPSGSLMRYVYVGDTGELDQQAGETMLREYPELVQAVFLHVVSDEEGQGDGYDAGGDTVVLDPTVPPPKLIYGRPLVFFRTYVGAAIAAVQLNLMSLDGLRFVTEAAERQLLELNAQEMAASSRSTTSGAAARRKPSYDSSRDTRWRDLRRDLSRANHLSHRQSPLR